MNGLITIKQLPVLEDKFKSLGEEIQKKVDEAKGLVCTEETRQSIKKVRATLNKEAQIYDDEFKNIKSQVLEPWEKVERAYQDNIKLKYKAADSDLKSKINEVENILKDEKEAEIRSYFDEYVVSKGIDFVTFEQSNINITLSASKKSLKDQVTEFIDKICDDLALIETQDHKAEIMVEYKRSLNCSQAITTVANRIQAIEEQKQREEQRKREREEREAREAEIKSKAISFAQEVAIQPPVLESKSDIPQPKKLKLHFTVVGTVEELKKLKNFLEVGGYDYE